MLRRLSVRNLAVLAGGEIELGPGLNVLTGETGAGKSLVVDSLALLAGARAAGDLIREGTEGATVSGIFDCDAALRSRLRDAGIEVGSESLDEELVIRREISREGPESRLHPGSAGDSAAPAGARAALLRIHGQRDELGWPIPSCSASGWTVSGDRGDRAGGPGGRAL